jgi:hypothetical protein
MLTVVEVGCAVTCILDEAESRQAGVVCTINWNPLLCI